MRKKRQKKKENKFLKLKIALLVFFILFFSGVGLLMSPYGPFIQKGALVFSDMCVQKAQFNLEKVIVEGHIRTRIEDVNRQLNLKRGMKIFEVNLEQEKEAVLALPWVKTVRIERHLPTHILISLTEKTPIAVWQNKKRYLPIDEDGNPILDDKTVLKNLLLVVGEDAPAHTPELVSLLKEYPEIGTVSRAAVRVGNRRWNLYLNDAENGLEIRLPETDIKAALERLKTFKEEGDILNRDLKVIDLKLPDRLIVKSSESLEERSKNGKKN